MRNLVIGIDCWALRLNGGGARFVFESLIEKFKPSRHKFILFLHPEAKICFEEVQSRVGIFFNVIKIVISAPEEIYRLEKFIDILYCPFNNISVRLFDKPVVSVLHDIQEQFLPELFSREDIEARTENYKDILRSSDYVITISDFCKDSFVEKYNADPSKIEVIYNAPQESLLKYASEITSEYWEVNTIPFLNKPFIIYPANFYPHKNHNRLFAAYHTAKERGIELPDLVLVGMIFGDNSISFKIKDYGIEEKVHILSSLSPAELATLYKRSQFVILPTLFEGFCLPAVEALAFGKLLVCSSLPILHEICNNEAIFFDPYNSDSILESLMTACHIIDTSNSNKIEIRRRIASIYDWKTSAYKTLNLLENTYLNYSVKSEDYSECEIKFRFFVVYSGEPENWLNETLTSIYEQCQDPEVIVLYFSNLPNVEIHKFTLIQRSIKYYDGRIVKPLDFMSSINDSSFCSILFSGNTLCSNFVNNILKEYRNTLNIDIFIGEVRQVHEDKAQTFESNNYFRIVNGHNILQGHLYPEMFVLRSMAFLHNKTDWMDVWSFWEMLPKLFIEKRVSIVRRTFAKVRFRSQQFHYMKKQIASAISFQPSLVKAELRPDFLSLSNKQLILDQINEVIAPKIGILNPPVVTEISRMY